MKTKFKYDYKSPKAIASLSAEQLIAYKKAMNMQADNLRDEATQWALTFKTLLQEINDRHYELQCMQLEAELDRIDSDDYNFGIVGFIH